MSSLRRRIFGGSELAKKGRAASPAPIFLRSHSADQIVSVPAAKIEEFNRLLKERRQRMRGSKRWNAWVFVLGGIAGLLLAAFLAGRNDMVDLAYLRDMNLESLIDVLPTNIVHDAKALQDGERAATSYDSFQVGLFARKQGIAAKHPVIMIPGVISTGLESWGTEDDSRQYFRKRLWGSWSMMRALLLDKASWKRHIMLDHDTGLDPRGIKLRAAQGFDAADFFITGYWIWNKILENLATIGYDPSNAFTAAYDWRLSYGNLEVRDQYFTRLKMHIETASRTQGQKTVLLSHSMGSQVLFYFFHWVEAEGFGNGGPDWVNDHIEAWINISGCMLGAVKDVTAVLSGEMRDTAQLNAFAVYGLEKFLSRHERAEIFRAMPGLSSMLPIGGDAVWGDETGAPDDPPNSNVTFGRFITFRNRNDTELAQNLTVTKALPYLLRNTPKWYADAIRSNYSHGVAHTTEEVERNQLDPQKWINPLESRLPKAPNMKIYCFYGVGKPTERSYYYRVDRDILTSSNISIDTAYTSAPHVDHGVVMGEGDGTVNLMSVGYMCNKGWLMKRYNPSGINITVSEMLHEPDRFSPRGGPNTGDHVDILGRSSLNDLILKVAGGKGHTIPNSRVSNILKYVDKVKINDEE